MTAPTKRPAVGIRRLETSWQAYLRVNGRLKTKCFPLATPLSTMKAWREEQRVAAKYGLRLAGEIRSFAKDAQDYLGLVQGMPSYADRAYHIDQWTRVFGSRVRASLTPREIRQQLEAWRRHGHINGGPLANGSLNRRRTALMDLYTELDGRRATNPVKDVPKYDERHSEQVRAFPMLTCARVIRRVKPRHQARYWLHALLWTGWPNQLLAQIRPEDVDWVRGRVWVHRRQKARGADAAWIPVLPRTLAVLRRFLEARGAKTYSPSSLGKTLRIALAAENRIRAQRREPLIPDMHPYVLRHSFATWAAGILKDDRALMELLRTKSIKRYTEGATNDRLEHARTQLAAALRNPGATFATSHGSLPGITGHPRLKVAK